MKYHNVEITNSLGRNLRIVICRVFGHRINKFPAHHWCDRCNMAYEECYHPLDYNTTRLSKPIEWSWGKFMSIVRAAKLVSC